MRLDAIQSTCHLALSFARNVLTGWRHSHSLEVPVPVLERVQQGVRTFSFRARQFLFGETSIYRRPARVTFFRNQVVVGVLWNRHRTPFRPPRSGSEVQGPSSLS